MHKRQETVHHGGYPDIKIKKHKIVYHHFTEEKLILKPWGALTPRDEESFGGKGGC